MTARADLLRTIGRVLAVVPCALTMLAASSQRRGLRLDTPSGGPAILAVGDTVTLTLHQELCHGDVCERVAGAPPAQSYRSGNRGIVTVTPSGRLEARAPGRTSVDALTSDGRVRAEVRVLPASKSIEWSTRARQARTGDTLRVFVIARDADGQAVGSFPPEARVGTTGTILDWDAHGSAVVWLDHPGLLVLAARLGNRTDTLRIQVR